ncbi:DUF2000 domain-containing protein [Mucilaginibacter sp. BJC16-A38]|uniref:DUF2000 domain-containing protein n=1 Tax=Mucilaginibacter phenanthrenivorans TaxID=1234842 RepID=UPI00215725AA|nr:DUF2000 domain-containing protein [Mucilaginibacter phenanthrenivorans]MCR8556135.1 DUF2000 domain-containing protein [Mucilaginibacter phenanthrenivorans]
MHENKIVIIVRDDLKTWQKLNVTAFLASAVAIEFPELHGRQLVTASGNTYLPFLKQPMLVYKADDLNQMQRIFKRAKERELKIGIYSAHLFDTMTEQDNLDETARYTDDEQDLVGLVIYGENKKVNKAIDGLKFHD